MNDIAIRARDLRKVYRLYAKPHFRFLDMFGLLGRREDAYREHVALDGLSVNIRRGEKVAIIGRNGAGKSTFLKLVTGVVEPTSGEIHVAGHAHALLQIGTGFHPDFSGRDNVYAYLAQLGITGAEATRKCAEVVEFAELEEYIDQPVKTYSSGMAVRLMFSTSTAITPDLLVLDEVLGVGDAYFARKSFDRIQRLCQGEGTTLLLVSHDVYSASAICSRMIWIDRGSVVMDGEAPVVIKAYEDSVRQQEEARLRLKHQEALRTIVVADRPAVRYVIVELQSQDSRPLRAPLYVSELSVTVDGLRVAVQPAVAPFDAAEQGCLQREGSAWGEPTEWDGRSCRPFLNYGSSFHKVSASVPVPSGALRPDSVIRAEATYWMNDPEDVQMSVFVEDRAARMGALPADTGRWSTMARSIKFAEVRSRAEVVVFNTAGVYGSGAIVVSNATFIDAQDREVFFLTHGEPATMRIDYRVASAEAAARTQVVAAFHRDGVTDVCRVIGRLRLQWSADGTGTLRLRFPRLSLTDGKYSVTIMIAADGYYDRDQTVFYAINPEVYYCASRLFEFTVEGAGLIGRGTLQVPEAEWSTTVTS